MFQITHNLICQNKLIGYRGILVLQGHPKREYDIRKATLELLVYDFNLTIQPTKSIGNIQVIQDKGRIVPVTATSVKYMNYNYFVKETGQPELRETNEALKMLYNTLNQTIFKGWFPKTARIKFGEAKSGIALRVESYPNRGNILEIFVSRSLMTSYGKLREELISEMTSFQKEKSQGLITGGRRR